ncbi:MAG: hypothetical protein JW751_19050 [Polyangiaceae bacterium]|nr:hypothetical protein [Polyangiaceae bacterium]
MIPVHFGVPLAELIPPLPVPNQPVAREKDGVHFGSMCVSLDSLRATEDTRKLLIEPAVSAIGRLIKAGS